MTVHRVLMCLCGHEKLRWHEGNGRGACRYGRDHALGGCSCPSYHRSRRPAPHVEGTPMPAELSLEARLDGLLAACLDLRRDLHGALDAFDKRLAPLRRSSSSGLLRAASASVEDEPAKPPPPKTTRPLAARAAPAAYQNGLTLCGTTLLGILAQYDPEPLDAARLLLVAGYRESGSTSAALADLRRLGYVSGGRGEPFHVTEEGRANAMALPTLPKGAALIAMWKEKLPACPSRLLGILYDDFPSGVALPALLHAANYKESGSTSAAIATLRKLRLVEGNAKNLRIADGVKR